MNTGLEIPSGASVLSNLTFQNTAAVTLNSSPQVNGLLSLSGANVITGGNTLVMNLAATRARTSGQIIGNERRTFSGGSFLFDVGTANGYSPVMLSNVSGSGDFTVSSTQGPATATGLPANRLQRYWTLTNSGLSQADLTFNYLAADIPGGIESNYRTYRIVGGSATLVPSSTNTVARTTFAPGVTTFSDWTTAEAPAGTLSFKNAPYSDNDTNADHTFTVTVQRTAGSAGTVGVHYATSAGTAIPTPP